MSVMFSDKSEKKFAEVIARYPRKEAALLPVLWIAQEEFEVLTPEVRQYVADRLEISRARVESVVSFYTMYQTKPVGKYLVEICRNISCSLRGCESLMEHVESSLKIKPGQTTKDGLVTYNVVECIAVCGGAPAIQVNGEFHLDVTTEKLEDLIKDMQSSG